MSRAALFKKIQQVQASVKAIEKTGEAKGYASYKYAEESEVLRDVKAAWLDAGLCVITTGTDAETGETQTPNGKLSKYARVRVHYAIVDVDTGEMVETSSCGYAENSGDKAIYSATTGANKYFLMKFFGIPTGDDPESFPEEAPQEHNKNDQNKPQRLETARQATATLEARPKPDGPLSPTFIGINKLVADNGITMAELATQTGYDSLPALKKASEQALTEARRQLDAYLAQRGAA